MADHLLIHRSEHAVELTLNRPDRRNALSRALIHDLTAALRNAEADPAVRSVVLTGAPPAFSAGLDLKEVAASTPEQAEQDANALVTLFETIDGLSKPVIGATPGPAVAGGAGLLSVCDLVLCAESAVIGYPEVKRGLIAAVVMTYLRRLVGERQAKYLLLTGESVSAAQAVEIGLATEVVADGDLLLRARHYAALFASMPPIALAQSKALWSRIRPLQHAEAIAAARRLNAAMRTSDESRAAIGQFFKG